MSQPHADDGQTDHLLSDIQIDALTPAQRRELIRRLQRPIGDVMPTGYAASLRRAHLGLMIGGAVFLIPWICYLAFTLPRTYMVRDWPVI